ncbi:MAG: helix-turn-helix transcriptional regulator [Deltaproteobacteria bacterium]|nr:helix-turn-helix transcriptional regulator [Candidatus Anaeroferrophillacea bacterium]
MIPKEKRNEYYESYLRDLASHFDQQEAVHEGLRIGEKIRRVREEQGLTLEQLAEKTGFSVDLLQQIEVEEITPPLGTVMRLSKALNTVMSTIISSDGPDRQYCVLRVADQKTAPLPQGKTGDHSYIPLSAALRDRHMDAFIVKLNPASRKTLAPAVHEGEEFIYVLDGEVKAVIGSREEVLGIGDTIYLKSSASHIVTTNIDQPALILAVLYSGS